MNRSSLHPWLCNKCKDHNDHPSSRNDWDEIMECSTDDYGKHHSFDDKPSLVFKNKTRIWHKNGLMHRDNGQMAMECHCGVCTKSYVWAENGKFHREDGPSLVQCVKPWTEIYSLRGTSFNSKEEYENNLRCKSCKRISDTKFKIYCTVNEKGQHHSFDGHPSQIMRIGNQESLRWHQDGLVHKVGGPASTFKTNGKTRIEMYYLKNIAFSKTKYLVELQTYQRKIIMSQLRTTISQSLRHTTTLPASVEAIVLACCTIGAPFSSGEIARYIRIDCPNIIFAVPQVGRLLRDMYIDFNMEYNVSGVKFQACRADRYNDSGHLVYVYGPTQYTAETHDFKVDIPAPVKVKQIKQNFQSALQQTGQTIQDLSRALYTNPIKLSLTALPVQSQRRIIPRIPNNTQNSQQKFTLLSEKAKVHTQSRLAVPSTALEKLPTTHGGCLQPGSTVSFVVNNGILKIVAGSRAGWEQKTIQANRGSCGRLYFTPVSLGISGLTYRDCKNIELDDQEKELRITL